VLYRVTMQAGLLGWAWQSTVGTRGVTDCIATIIFDGLAGGTPGLSDQAAAITAANEAKARWEADSKERLAGRRGGSGGPARSVRAARPRLTASKLYRYFEYNDSIIVEILGYFSDQTVRSGDRDAPGSRPPG
jgi:hypothetical protein